MYCVSLGMLRSFVVVRLFDDRVLCCPDSPAVTGTINVTIFVLKPFELAPSLSLQARKHSSAVLRCLQHIRKCHDRLPSKWKRVRKQLSQA